MKKMKKKKDLEIFTRRVFKVRSPQVVLGEHLAEQGQWDLMIFL